MSKINYKLKMKDVFIKEVENINDSIFYFATKNGLYIYNTIDDKLKF